MDEPVRFHIHAIGRNILTGCYYSSVIIMATMPFWILYQRSWRDTVDRATSLSPSSRPLRMRTIRLHGCLENQSRNRMRSDSHGQETRREERILNTEKEKEQQWQMIIRLVMRFILRCISEQSRQELCHLFPWHAYLKVTWPDDEYAEQTVDGLNPVDLLKTHFRESAGRGSTRDGSSRAAREQHH